MPSVLLVDGDQRDAVLECQGTDLVGFCRTEILTYVIHDTEAESRQIEPVFRTRGAQVNTRLSLLWGRLRRLNGFLLCHFLAFQIVVAGECELSGADCHRPDSTSHTYVVT